MRVALVDSNRGKSNIYPLALLKIGAWQKSLGNFCQMFDNDLPEAGKFDEIWITTVFTFDIPYAVNMTRQAMDRADVVKVGGVSATLLPEYFTRTGAKVHRGLIPEAERFSPDYSLLGFEPEYSIVYTTTGCIRSCKFCVVPKLEPEFITRDNWISDIHPATKKILFFDNNWLASEPEKLRKDVSILRSLVDQGRVNQIDFNQGFDARIMNEEIVDLLNGLPFNPVRFAFDGPQEYGYYEKAVRLMAERGYISFVSYMLYNFVDSPTEFYYRLRVNTLLSQELGIQINSFPMRYQPIMELDLQRQYTGKHWTLEKRNGFMRILNHMSPFGMIHCAGIGSQMTPVEEFEFWFGKDAGEFERLLTYPDLAKLSNAKRGYLRHQRIAHNQEVERRLNEIWK